MTREKLMILDTIQNFLEYIDNYRDKFFCRFVRPVWPKKVIPNHITYIRVFIGIALFILLFFFKIENKALIVSLFCVGVLTDLTDGPVARGMDNVTEFGAMLDSTADRILIIPIAIYSLFSSHKWLLLYLLLMEIINSIASIFYKSKEIYLESNIYGKTKMVLLCFVFIAILAVWPSSPPEFFFYILWASIIFSFLSIFTRILELNSKGHIKNKILNKQLDKYETQSKDL
jgi:phosphatidylglycerophosphate synthase